MAPRLRNTPEELAQRNARAGYWRKITISGGCVMCRHFPPEKWARRNRAADLELLDAHHCLPKSILKREGHRHWRVIYDERNGLCLCRFHHQRHTDWIQRVPRELLPDGILEFVDVLGLGWVLDREYP